MSKERLLNETDSFFKMYWNSVNGEHPVWSKQWFFDNEIPNNDKRGYYVLLEEEKIVYIGVGLGKSFGKYHGTGLGDRLKRYWKLNKQIGSEKRYKPRSGWEGLTSLMTVGSIMTIIILQQL